MYIGSGPYFGIVETLGLVRLCCRRIHVGIHVVLGFTGALDWGYSWFLDVVTWGCWVNTGLLG